MSINTGISSLSGLLKFPPWKLGNGQCSLRTQENCGYVVAAALPLGQPSHHIFQQL